MIKAAFLTLGCKLNYAETSTYEREFVRYGVEIVAWRDRADLYVVNTCTVTAVSDAKSRNVVRKVHRVNPDARIVVTGCSAELRKSDYETIEGVSLVIGAEEKSSLVCRSLALFGLRTIDCSQSKVFAAFSTGERTRSFLKVQDGCDNFCKYCTVPYARGRSRNVPICECVAAARAISRTGIKEIVLTGVNTGDFGRTTGESFLDLLKALNEVEGIERYRISSIEPNLLTNEIIDWIASGTKFQPHFHIPLQNGTDEILEAMGRKYTTGFFADKIEYIRAKMENDNGPKVFFGIDVMVGLPGESSDSFNRTVAFLKQIRPAFIHVFPYSKRPGTPAAAMTAQVADEEKKRRVSVLETLCTELHAEFVQNEKGKSFPVLFESKDKNGMMSGFTSNYLKVTKPYDKNLVGKIVEVKFEGE